MMPFHTIFCDLDGTLLNSKKEVSEETLHTLWQMKHEGFALGIASGRSVDVILRLGRQWGMNGLMDYIIGSNGTQIYLCRKGTLYHQNLMDPKHVHRLACAMYEEKANLYVADMMSHTAYIQRMDEYACYFQKVNDIVCHVCDIRKLRLQEYHKVLIMQEENKLTHCAVWIENHMQEEFMVYRTLPFTLEVVNRHASKWSGIQRLCQLINISTQHIIAIGDQENDIAMLQNVGWGVAMCNAPPAVKNIANAITRWNNDEDGAARYLKEFIWKDIQ